MLRSLLFMLLCSAAWTIAIPSSLISRGSVGEVEAGSPGCGATYWRGLRMLPPIPIYAGCIALTSIPTSHLMQDRVLGVAVLDWLGALLSARAMPPSLFLCRPS